MSSSVSRSRRGSNGLGCAYVLPLPLIVSVEVVLLLGGPCSVLLIPTLVLLVLGTLLVSILSLSVLLLEVTKVLVLLWGRGVVVVLVLV